MQVEVVLWFSSVFFQKIGPKKKTVIIPCSEASSWLG